MSCGVGCRHGLDPALLRLWHRPAATTPIGPLAWEPPCAAETALETAERPKKKKNCIKIPTAKGAQENLGARCQCSITIVVTRYTCFKTDQTVHFK